MCDSELLGLLTVKRINNNNASQGDEQEIIGSLRLFQNLKQVYKTINNIRIYLNQLTNQLGDVFILSSSDFTTSYVTPAIKLIKIYMVKEDVEVLREHLYMYRIK